MAVQESVDSSDLMNLASSTEGLAQQSIIPPVEQSLLLNKIHLTSLQHLRPLNLYTSSIPSVTIHGVDQFVAALPAKDRIDPQYEANVEIIPRWNSDCLKVGRTTGRTSAFIKERKAGSISLLYEQQLRKRGIHGYAYTISTGKISAADGAGFVFANRVPCSKNVKRLWSIFMNRTGKIFKRMGANLIPCGEADLPSMSVGNTIYMVVDLNTYRITFQVSNYYDVVLGRTHIDFSDIAEKVDASSGYFCAAIARTGVLVRLKAAPKSIRDFEEIHYSEQDISEQPAEQNQFHTNNSNNPLKMYDFPSLYSNGVSNPCAQDLPSYNQSLSFYDQEIFPVDHNSLNTSHQQLPVFSQNFRQQMVNTPGHFSGINSYQKPTFKSQYSDDDLHYPSTTSQHLPYPYPLKGTMYGTHHFENAESQEYSNYLSSLPQNLLSSNQFSWLSSFHPLSDGTDSTSILDRIAKPQQKPPTLLDQWLSQAPNNSQNPNKNVDPAIFSIDDLPKFLSMLPAKEEELEPIEDYLQWNPNELNDTTHAIQGVDEFRLQSDVEEDETKLSLNDRTVSAPSAPPSRF